MRRFLVSVCVVGALASAPSSASAETICVNASGGCDQTATTLQSALTSAAAAGATTIKLGSGTYSSPSGLSYTEAQALTIVGSGNPVITAASLSTAGSVLRLRSTTLSGVTVRIPSTVSFDSDYPSSGLSLSGGSIATGVRVEHSGSATAQGVHLESGTSLSDSVVDQGKSAGYGIVAGGNVEDTTVTCGNSQATAIRAAGGRIERSELSCGNGVYNRGSTGSVLESVVIRTSGREANNYGVWQTSSYWIVDGTYHSTASMKLDGVTLVGAGGSSKGILASADQKTSQIQIYSSIVTGYGTYLNASGANASVAAVWSMIKFGSESGSVSCNSCSNEADAARPGPGFISATDLRLRQDSPAIDAADPVQPGVDHLAFEGNARELDGNGDGDPRRDMGAYEMPAPGAPVLSAFATPNEVLPGAPVTFSASVSDPNPGDTASYTWAFGDGSAASGASVTKTFATLGTHTAVVTARDSTGRTDVKPVSVLVTRTPDPDPVPNDGGDAGGGSGAPPGSGPGTEPGAGKDRVPPVLTALRVTPASFRLGSLLPVLAAAKGKRPPNKTTISFTLSEAASVGLSFAMLEPGVRKGKLCVAAPSRRPSRKARPKPCTRSVSVRGAIAVSGRKGKNRVSFAGKVNRRISLRAGRYTLAVLASDAAGNSSKPATARFRIVR